MALLSEEVDYSTRDFHLEWNYRQQAKIPESLEMTYILRKCTAYFREKK